MLANDRQEIKRSSPENGNDVSHISLKGLRGSGGENSNRVDVVKNEGSRVSLMIKEKGVHIEHVDFVVYTKGMVPESSLKNRLKGKTELFLVGDCKEVGRAMDAIHSAHECAVSV